MRTLRLLLSFLLLNLTGCEQIALKSTPNKKPIQSHSKAAMDAKRYFWKTLHNGRYQDIELADQKLMMVYLQNPNDPELAADIAFLHLWKITERNPADKNPLIPNEIVLAHHYFSEASTLEPNNAIYKGFLGNVQLAEGTIFHDRQEEVRGYFTLKKAISMWPQFNYFTAGYPMSTLHPGSKYFKEGLEWQWNTLERCSGHTIDRKNPNYQVYIQSENRQGKQRACWNSWIAPYNFEGFFLNMGDMLVKSGDWQTGITIYQNAKLAKNYSSWPYRDMLEKRIQNVKTNVHYFPKNMRSTDRSVLFNSGHGCMACHQNPGSYNELQSTHKEIL